MLRLANNYRRCLYFNDCKQEEHYNGKRWQKKWNRYNNGFICDNHYYHKVSRFRRTKEDNKRFNDRRTKEYLKKCAEKFSPRRIAFGNKRITLWQNLRTGYCSVCPNNIYDGSCKKTDTHHYFYLPIMVWACTIELCASCHAYESHRLKQIVRREVKDEKCKTIDLFFSE